MKLTSASIQKHLMKGLKIRRSSWQKGVFLKSVNSGNDVSALYLYNRLKKDPELWIPGIRQIFALDWEIIKE